MPNNDIVNQITVVRPFITTAIPYQIQNCIILFCCVFLFVAPQHMGLYIKVIPHVESVENCKEETISICMILTLCVVRRVKKGKLLLKQSLFFEKRGLKGYYVDRDLMPGRNIINEYYRVIRHSAYTIIVIDEELVRRPWPSYLGQSTMKFFTDDNNIDKLIVMYVGLTKNYFTKWFPEYNMTQTVYFPYATLRDCDKNVLEKLVPALRGLMDVHDALVTPVPLSVQSEEDKQTRGHE
jgi:hypothetical protein